VGRWRELAAERVGHAAIEGSTPLFHGLAGDLARNLRSLEHMRQPRGVDRRQWKQAVHDAISLARGGWVQAALALGWDELDLFGIGPTNSWEFSGLAVWLDGRTLTALDGRMAFAGDARSRAVFHRGGWGCGRDAGLGAPVPIWAWRRS
jgi:hypothetical protein